MIWGPVRTIRTPGSHTRTTRCRGTLSGVVLGIGAIWFASPAQADDSRSTQVEHIVVFPLHGELPKQHQGVFRAVSSALQEQAKKRSKQVTVSESSVADMAMISGCDSADDADCQATMLEQLGADVGITGTIAPGKQPDRVTVRLQYFTGDRTPVRKRFTIDANNARQDFERVVPALFGEPVKEPERLTQQPQPTAFDDAAPTGFAFGRVKRRSWIVAGGGGALVGTGIVFWLLADREQGRIARSLVDTGAQLDELVVREDRAQSRATVGNVLFLSGVAVAAVGVVMAVREGLSPRKAAVVPAAGKRVFTNIRLVPVSARGNMGLGLHMEWR